MGVGRRVLLFVLDILLVKTCSVNAIAKVIGFLHSILVVLEIVFIAISIQHTIMGAKRNDFLRGAIIDRWDNLCCVARGNDDNDEGSLVIESNRN